MSIQNVPKVERAALALPDEAKALRITSDREFQVAGLFLRERCKQVLGMIDETFNPIIQASHLAHKEACDAKKKVSAPVLEAEKIVKGVMARYSDERERERQKLQAEAERKAREQAAIEAAERAQVLEAEGLVEEAEAVRAEPVRAVAVVVAPAAPKAEGVSMRKKWSFRIVDEAKVSRQYLAIDEVKIRKIVSALGAEAAQAVGGIEVYEETVAAASRA